MPRPIVFCIDVEPNDHVPRTVSGEPWSGFRESLPLLADLRMTLQARTGRPVRFSWFLRIDEQMARQFGSDGFIVEQFGDELKRLRDDGDEIGLHPHAYRWSENEKHWFNEFADPAWTEALVARATEGFERAMGYPARISRFGERWMDNDAMAALERLGIRYDLTPEPGRRGERIGDTGVPATGPLPDYRGVPRHPYRPSRRDFRRPGNGDARNVWVLPVTTPPARWRISRRPPFVLKHCTSALNAAFDPAQQGPLLDQVLAADPTLPVVAVMRAGDLATPEFHHNIPLNLRNLAQHPAIEDTEFVTPMEAVERFDQTGAAR